MPHFGLNKTNKFNFSFSILKIKLHIVKFTFHLNGVQRQCRTVAQLKQVLTNYFKLFRERLLDVGKGHCNLKNKRSIKNQDKYINVNVM